MTDSGMEMTLQGLAKKVDDQARFTRSVVICCTLAIVGTTFYSLTEMFSNLPALIVLQYMSNLEKIVYEWKSVEQTIDNGKSKIGAPAPKAAK